MPGMMDTVLNRLQRRDRRRLARSTDNPRFAFDSYRRFIQMYANVVMDVAGHHLESHLERVKEREGIYNDSELSVEALKGLAETYKAAVTEAADALPQDPMEQLWLTIDAVRPGTTGARVTPRGPRYPARPRHSGQRAGDGLREHGANQPLGWPSRVIRTGERRFFGEWLRNAKAKTRSRAAQCRSLSTRSGRRRRRRDP